MNGGKTLCVLAKFKLTNNGDVYAECLLGYAIIVSVPHSTAAMLPFFCVRPYESMRVFREISNIQVAPSCPPPEHKLLKNFERAKKIAFFIAGSDSGLSTAVDA